MFREYFGISPSYREKLTTVDGKNAETLLTNSLEQIELELMSVLNKQQEDNLTQMSVTNRYLKSRV